MTTDDAALLARYSQRKDAEAFTELVRRHAGLVHGTCLRILGDSHDADDVAQECFMELAMKAGTVATSLPGWLHAAATSRSLGTIRSSARRRKREEVTALNEQTSSSEPTWEAIAFDVDQALADLPEELRLPLVLHYLQGKGQGEVAQELAISQSTVSRRLETGVDELRKKLQKTGIVTSVALLASLLSANGATAAPATLLAALGKMALAGIGGPGGTASAPTAAAPVPQGLLGATAGKAAIVGMVAVVALILVAVYRKVSPSGAEPERPFTEAVTIAQPQPATRMDIEAEQATQEGEEMKKLWMIGAGVVTMTVTGAMAQGEPTIGGTAAPGQNSGQVTVGLKEMAFEGVVRLMSSGLVLVTDDGTLVRLPMSVPTVAGAVDLKTYDGSRVKVVGMGGEARTNSGKKSITLKSIKTIDKVAP